MAIPLIFYVADRKERFGHFVCLKWEICKHLLKYMGGYFQVKIQQEEKHI